MRLFCVLDLENTYVKILKMGSLKLYVCSANTEPFLTVESRDIEQALKLFPELSNGNKGLYDLTALQVNICYIILQYDLLHE